MPVGDGFIKFFQHLFAVLRQGSAHTDLEHIVHSIVVQTGDLKQGNQQTVLHQIFQFAGRSKASCLVIAEERRAPVEEKRKVDNALRLGAVKKQSGLLCIFRSSARSGNAGHDVGVENHAGVFHPFDLTVRLLEVVVLLGKGKHIVQPAFDAKIEPTHPLVVQQPQFLVRLLADVGDGGIHIDHPAAGKVAVYQLQDLRFELFPENLIIKIRATAPTIPKSPKNANAADILFFFAKL